MKQSNLFQRSCPGHPGKQVLLACSNKSCNLNRLLCMNCEKFHFNHTNDLLDEQEIEQKTKESSKSCQQLIQQLYKMLSEIQSQFKILISTLESEYIFSLESLNTMENKQLIKYFNQLAIQSEAEKYINEQITNGLNDFKQQINKCLNNFQLEKISSKEISNQDLQKANKLYTLDSKESSNQDLQKANKLYTLDSKESSNQDLEKANKLYTLGVEYYKKDDDVNAIKMFDQALQINQKHINSLISKGYALSNLGQHKESIEWYDKALKIDPQHRDVLRAKGDSLIELGRLVEADECLTQANKKS